MKRITRQKLAVLVNEILDRVEMPFETSTDKITPTRFTRDQYEGGATKLYINCFHKTNPEYNPYVLYSLYNLKEIGEVLERGETLNIQNYGPREHNQYWLTSTK